MSISMVLSTVLQALTVWLVSVSSTASMHASPVAFSTAGVTRAWSRASRCSTASLWLGCSWPGGAATPSAMAAATPSSCDDCSAACSAAFCARHDAPWATAAGSSVFNAHSSLTRIPSVCIRSSWTSTSAACSPMRAPS
eukprot:364495-Chlamydomonas_euryale.AAC.1